MMQIEVEIKKYDLLELNKQTVLKRSRRRQVFIAVVGTALWLLVLNYGKPIDAGAIIFGAVLSAIFWTLAIAAIRYFTIRQIKSYYAEDGGSLGLRTYAIEETGFREKTDESEALTKWSAILEVRETEYHIFVFIDKLAAYIIPKRYFPSASEANGFLAALKERTNGD